MLKESETNPVVVRSVVILAVLASAAAGIVFWSRLPATRSRRLIDRCDDALKEMESRSHGGEFREFGHAV